MQTSDWPDCLPRPGNQNLKRLPSLSPWFEIYEVNSQTFAVLEPNHYEEAISFLITGSRLAVLFDTGMGIGNLKDEVEHLTDLPVIVVNSHYHNDHVGEDYKFTEVWAFDHEDEIRAIEAGISIEDIRYSILKPHRNLPVGFDPSQYCIHPARVTGRLHHNQEVELGERILKVLHTPGHSPGSICLLDPKNRLLFTGDTYYPGMLFANNPDSNYPDYRSSIRNLISLLPEIDLLCTAHNEAVMPQEELLRLQSAFNRIDSGQGKAFPAGEDSVYFKFDTFKVMMKKTDLPVR